MNPIIRKIQIADMAASIAVGFARDHASAWVAVQAVSIAEEILDLLDRKYPPAPYVRPEPTAMPGEPERVK